MLASFTGGARLGGKAALGAVRSAHFGEQRVVRAAAGSAAGTGSGLLWVRGLIGTLLVGWGSGAAATG